MPDPRRRARTSVIAGRRSALVAIGSVAGSLIANVVRAQPQAPESDPGPRILRVGPDRALRSLAAAAKVIAPGDTIELDAGDYPADAAVIARDNVRIVGVGGRARFIAQGASVEGKGVLVVRAHGVTIENVEVTGARVADHYGTGIRLERGSLRVANSRFANNELSIMTANDPKIVLEIEDCEFSGLVNTGGRGGALSHALYAGAIDVLRVTGSYFHDGSAGHLLKSRARVNDIRYNRLTDERGVSSYELEFPDGGIATVVGNLIEQGPRTGNPTIISYGAEGARWAENRLDVLFNTVVNNGPAGGRFVTVRSAAAALRIRHNVFVGPGSLDLRVAGDVANNVNATARDFVDPARFDYRPRLDAPWVGNASALPHAFPKDLSPAREYRHPASTLPLDPGSRLLPLNPGALQLMAP